MSPSTVWTASQTAPATGFYELSCRTKRFSSATRQLPAASSLRRAEVARKAFTAVLVSRTEKPNRRAKGLSRTHDTCRCRHPNGLLIARCVRASARAKAKVAASACDRPSTPRTRLERASLHRPDADCRDPKELLATSLSQASEPQAYVGAGLRRNGRRLPSLPSVT